MKSGDLNEVSFLGKESEINMGGREKKKKKEMGEKKGGVRGKKKGRGEQKRRGGETSHALNAVIKI